jgi:hypothetical protein
MVPLLAHVAGPVAPRPVVGGRSYARATSQGRLQYERSDMSATTLMRPREPFPVAITGLAISPAAPGLWRVARADGTVLGHIERIDAGERYRVRRLMAGGVRSMPLGEFWTPHDAADVFR